MSIIKSQKLRIRQANAQDISQLNLLLLSMAQSREEGYFTRQLEAQNENSRVVWLAEIDESPAGFCVLNWAPKYQFYKRLDIPEIQDLAVSSQFRRQGIGRALILRCEKIAREKGKILMGMSVGLHHGFGPAQVLYAKLGYIPDGNGVTYDRQIVKQNALLSIDDDLCLMLVKELR